MKLIYGMFGILMMFLLVVTFASAELTIETSYYNVDENLTYEYKVFDALGLFVNVAYCNWEIYNGTGQYANGTGYINIAVVPGTYNVNLYCLSVGNTTIGAYNYTGPAGPEGPQGLPGTNGTNGIDGTNGVNGTNGIDGVNGTNGVDGTTFSVGDGYLYDNGSNVIFFNETKGNLTWYPYSGNPSNFLTAIAYQSSAAGWTNTSTTTTTSLNISTSAQIQYTTNGTIETYANACSQIANSTGIYWVC